jgi:hypothetical protein
MTNFREFYLAGHAAAQESPRRGGFTTDNIELDDLVTQAFDGASPYEVAAKAVDRLAATRPLTITMKKWRKQAEEDRDETFDDADANKAFAEWQRGWLDEAKMTLAEEIVQSMNESLEDDYAVGDGKEDDDDDEEEEDDDDDDD